MPTVTTRVMPAAAARASTSADRAGHQVQMAVAVERGGRQRLRVGAGGRPYWSAAPAVAVRWPCSGAGWSLACSSRASSSSTIDGSSLVNSGTGGLSGVPGVIGRDSQRAASAS